MQGTITLGHMFTHSLETPGEHLFWSVAGQQGLMVMGADVSNAFAEVPLPVAPLYIVFNAIFRNWWENHKQQPPIPRGYVMQVKHTLQGHPELPRHWEKHLDAILCKLGLSQLCMSLVYIMQ